MRPFLLVVRTNTIHLHHPATGTQPPTHHMMPMATATAPRVRTSVVPENLGRTRDQCIQPPPRAGRMMLAYLGLRMCSEHLVSSLPLLLKHLLQAPDELV